MIPEPAQEPQTFQLDWLAAAHLVTWSYRNTADGHKALISDGVLCEFAVFEPHELAHIPYAPGRFVWRRDEVAPTLAFPARPLPGPHGEAWLVGEALSNLLVGLMRRARGEKLSAMRLVQVHALDRVLELLETRRALSGSHAARRDPFSVERRIEARDPLSAAALPTWAGGYHGTPAAALSLLAALEAHTDVPRPVADRIRSLAAPLSHG